MELYKSMNKFINKILCYALCLIYLSVPLRAMQQIGPAQEQNILKLMYEYSNKLQKLACTLGVNSPKERLAWLLTMNTFLVRSQEAAFKAATDSTLALLQVEAKSQDVEREKFLYKRAQEEVRQEARATDLYFAMDAVRTIAHDIHEQIAWKLEKKPYLGALMGPIIMQAKEQAQKELLSSLSYDGKKAYQKAEQIILESFLEKFEIVFNLIYPRVLNILSKNILILEDQVALIKFNRNHLAQISLNPAQICFLVAWLGHMQPSDIFLQQEYFIFKQLRDDLYFYPVIRELFICQRQSDTSFYLCSDLICVILEYMIHAKIMLDDE
jgi:hypothetical protein